MTKDFFFYTCMHASFSTKRMCLIAASGNVHLSSLRHSKKVPFFSPAQSSLFTLRPKSQREPEKRCDSAMETPESLAAALAEADDPLSPATVKEACFRRRRDSEETETLSCEEDGGTKEELSWSEALDMLVGASPRTVWRTVNYCVPVLLLVSLFLLHLTRHDKDLFWLLSGFIVLLLAFAAALNWTLWQVLPPEEDGESSSFESDEVRGETLSKKRN
ncbi:putative transmembrane protein [Toxoplasma gondii CAST]|uniref:Putative transmembrane protein n=1 Tax=Toxoplasma gondii CAST TaxID=943122 RepID=A0A3R8GAU5_TOXGO|nr:putative transmembrane protein [Toxoplasma gondii CAST]